MPYPQSDHASPYPIPDQWLSTASPARIASQPSTYPNVWRVAGVRPGGPLKAAVLGPLAIAGAIIVLLARARGIQRTTVAAPNQSAIQRSAS